MRIANITDMGNGLNLVNVFDNVTDEFFGMGLTTMLDFDEESKTLTTSGLIYNNVDCLCFGY